jgi:hypothetical protein
MPIVMRRASPVMPVPVPAKPKRKRKPKSESRAITIGSRFGKLVVKEDLGTRRHGGKMRRFYLCLCDCGTDIIVIASNLLAGKKSCGCASTKIADPSRRYAPFRQPKCQCAHPVVHYDLSDLRLCVWCGRSV